MKVDCLPGFNVEEAVSLAMKVVENFPLLILSTKHR